MSVSWKPKENALVKLTTFVPTAQAEDVTESTCSTAGCGNIGNYDLCSYNMEGEGTFRAPGRCHPILWSDRGAAYRT